MFPHPEGPNTCYNPYFNGPTKFCKLKDLTRVHLSREIQIQEGVGHDSKEDALVALDLMKIESV